MIRTYALAFLASILIPIGTLAQSAGPAPPPVLDLTSSTPVWIHAPTFSLTHAEAG